MARKDTKKHPFPTEYEETVLNLLETYGPLAKPQYLADLLGVSGYALKGFLQTERAKEAMAKAHPDAKKILRPHIHLPSTTEDPALLDSDDLEGASIIESDIPEGLVSAYNLIKEEDD